MWIKRESRSKAWSASRPALIESYFSLAAFIIIIVVLGGFRIIPLAIGTSGSVGEASAEPTPVGVRETPETCQLGGGLPEEGLKETPLSWRPRDPQGVDRLTGHISRILACRVGSTSREALWLSLRVPSYAPHTPYLQLQ